MNFNVPGYTSLASVFQRAYDQAAKHKGAERHANDKPFHEQPMQTVANHHGIGFILGQASKKSIEAQGMLERGDSDKAIHELLGAINYLAGAIINIEMKEMRAAFEKVTTANGPGLVPEEDDNRHRKSKIEVIEIQLSEILADILKSIAAADDSSDKARDA